MSNFDFQSYIEEKQKKAKQGQNFQNYAYSGDQQILWTLRQIKPLEMAIASMVRVFEGFAKTELLGHSIRLSEKQFPHINKLIKICANTLDIPVPQVYIKQEMGHINAYTYGTEDESFIVIHSATIDNMDEQELLFVIGHEMGHIQNNHVVYGTLLHYLQNAASLMVRWAAAPGLVALNSWARRAEITSDRAGLLCCEDIETAIRVMVKFALGSPKLYSQVNIEEYLKQLDDVKEGLWRVSEFLNTHPYLPKRVEAIKLFALSQCYKSHIGEAGGDPIEEIDLKVKDIIKVL